MSVSSWKEETPSIQTQNTGSYGTVYAQGCHLFIIEALQEQIDKIRALSCSTHEEK
jgi:hypothetical protein